MKIGGRDGSDHYDAAISDYTTALNFDSTPADSDAHVYYLRSYAHKQLGETEKADEDKALACQKDSDNSTYCG
jgi:hypothetical protein